jgi:hypothetical protein
VRRHDDRRAPCDLHLDALRQIAPGRLVHPGEGLIEQQQNRIPYPRSRKEYPAQLAVGQLAQRPVREPAQIERPQRPPGRCAVGIRRLIVQTYARVASGLDDRARREILRMVGLQMWRDEADALLEFLQWHSRLDACPLDPATDGYPMIAV